MKKVKILLAVSGLFLFRCGQAQFAEPFADGELLTAPAWQGDASKFSVVDGKLRLQAPAASGSAVLATPSEAILDASWVFTVQLDFTPSSTNYAKIFLTADQPALAGPVHGYFVKVGNTTREVSLYLQTGTTETEIIDGMDDRVNQPVVSLRVKVTRSAAGRWELFTDVGHTGNLVLEGSVTNLADTESDWFVVQCVYTSTRSDKFWFDDFVVTGTRVPDTTPPSVVAVESTDPLEVKIAFDEPVSPMTVKADQVLIPSLGHPTALSRSADGMQVLCTLGSSLTNGVEYPIHLSGFADSAGNVMETRIFTVRYFKPGTPKAKSVLITEIFPDPSPQVGLPNMEYVELLNKSEDPYEVKGWTLTDGSSTGVFPSRVLLPGEYVVVTSTSGMELFQVAVGLANFPSLNNSGDRLRLRDAAGQPIDSVNYAVDWYREEDKAAGGWSLELIDPRNPCGEGDNWTASENEQGGTPGKQNSVYANKPDLTPPFVLEIQLTGTQRISVQFNELLEAQLGQDAIASLLPPLAIGGLSMNQTRRTLEVELTEALQPRTAYTLSLEGVRDCTGNPMEPMKGIIGLPEAADSLDVVLSEILFNPRSGGVDFVEVYNRSEKFIDLDRWTISNGDKEVFLSACRLAPHQLLALTSDPEIVAAQYPGPGVYHRTDLPTFADEEGSVWLTDSSGRAMDRLHYDKDWHSVFLDADEGVSLERIDYLRPTQSRDNWTSASSSCGFATPGRGNSQQRGSQATRSGIVVEPEIFVPENAGAGFTQIYYQFEQPGAVANVWIYDYQGRPVKELAGNALLGREGFLKWEGDRNDGSRAAPGYYVLWFEKFDSGGQTETFRKRIVIGWP